MPNKEKSKSKFEQFKSMTLEDFALWLDEHGQFDGSPWIKWWDENYCQDCDPEIVTVVDTGKEMECAWCEIHDKCRFFQEMDHIPESAEIIKMWLETEEALE